jgi:hypothetical protein
MGNPLQSIPGLPPAIGVSGAEQLWINQAGVDRRVTLAQIAASIVGSGSGAPMVGDYATLRISNYPPDVTAVVLDDPFKGGLFVRGPANSDNGGTRINDATGSTWYRIYDERINAAWFYSAPPDLNGNPTTLGSGPAQITQADFDANPQWIGLAGDGGVGVQTTQPYPIGTYWDFVALQEWIYACAADRSAPQTTFVGSMAGGQLTISQWLVGPQHLVVGQAVTGAGVLPGTVVVATTSDPNVYWTGGPAVYTAGFNATTASGNIFRMYIVGLAIDINATSPPAKPIVVGDEIIDPLSPPAIYYLGVQPGTTIGPQLGPGQLGPTYAAAVSQTVASEQMLGVGGPQWNTVGGLNTLNVPGYCPRGHMYLNQMLVCDGDGLDLFFASKLGTVLYWWGNAVNGVGNPKVGPAVKFNTLAYSVVRSLNVVDQSGGVTNYLVSLSHTPSAPGLNVENNSFSDWVISGNAATSQCGVAVSPEGGAAQGDTQTFNDCWVTGFNVGVSFGGDNAIGGAFFGGQTQACPQYGVRAAGGSFSAYTMLCENSITNYYATPQRTQVHLGGADFYAQQVATESCVVIGCRSEGVVGMIDYSRESLVLNWTCGGFFQNWAPNGHWTPATLLGVKDAFGNPVENFGLVMIADDGGPPWFYGTTDDAGLVVTVVAPPNPPPGWTAPNWTPNQWAGLGVWLRIGTTSSSHPIASNTANTLTLTAAVTKDTSYWWKIFGSSGAVAPNWGATTHFGQFIRNAGGWGVTIAQGFNLFSSATPVVAGDWVMVPGFNTFPDGSGITQALWGKAQNQHPASTGFYVRSLGNVATFWGTPTNPILLGSSVGAIPFNFLIAQTSGTPGGIGDYTLAFPSTVGADFIGSASASQLTVFAVANGTITAGQSLGGAGISTAPAPTITNAGAAITGYIDDGTGGTTPGGVLTITAILNGVTVLGAPLTGTDVAAGTVVLSLISGAQLAVTPSQLLPRCLFTASITAAGAVLTVTAISAGQLVQGQLIQGAGIPANLFLGAQISGVTGGIGAYSVNQTINIASEAMTAVWAMSVGGQGAGFTGRIDNGTTPDTIGNQLTVTAVSRGVLGVGQTINVPLTGGPTGATQQFTITALVTGAGGVGVYALSGSANVASTTMSANTTGGIGVYGVSPAFGAPISSEAMFSGYAAATPALWELRDNYGDAMNSALYGIDAFGYYSAGISDGQLTQMVIDFDIMWGVGAMDQCQLPFGKVGSIARLDNARSPNGVLTSQFIRPGENPLGEFAYKNAVTYAPPPRFGVVANTSPFTIGTSFLTQSNVFATVYQTNTVLGVAALGPGMVADIDLKLTPAATVGGGMIIDWDPATVKSAAPTLNIGAPSQNTIVRLKWIGNNLTATPGGFWYVSSVQGPM